MTQKTERDFSTKKRANMDTADFGDPAKRAFPVVNQEDLDNAARLLGHADNPAAVKKRLIAIAKRRGLSLPDSWKDDAANEDDDDGKQESTPSESASIVPVSGSGSSSPIHPRARIASIQVRWITDGARSVNGRVYPAETVNRLIASGQRKIADPDGLPVTCFLSHKDADSDHTPALIGKATRIWRSGADGMALLDIADTTHARNALGLIVGKYICTESLRASNAELRTDPRYDVPIVTGNNIELDGIDLTNYPGLEAVARIQQVHIAESAPAQPLTEVFALAPTALQIQQQPAQQKGQSMSKIHEAGDNTVNGYTPTSGDTVGMTNDPPQDSYGQRMYQQPEMTTGTMQGMTDASGVDLREAHDRIAMVQNRTCAPSQESARGQAILRGMSESERASVTEGGKALSLKNDAHLDKAHDALAHHMQMTCEGMNNKIPSGPPPSAQADDGMQDGDDDDNNNESATKGKAPMTREEQLAEARKLLEAEGYSNITPPPTAEQQLRESLLSDLRKEFAAQLAPQQQAAPSEPAPQRKSMVEGANVDKNSAKPYYQPGQYLRERINGMDWAGLADRTRPLPPDLDMKHLIREFEQLYALQYDTRFQILSATELR